MSAASRSAWLSPTPCARAGASTTSRRAPTSSGGLRGGAGRCPNTRRGDRRRARRRLAERSEPGWGEMSERETIHLAADISFIHTDYLWRMPGSWAGYPYYSTSDFYEDIARIAARGTMDLLFFGDNGCTPEA